MNEENNFHELDQLIRAYLHQDMELDASTVPEAIGRYAKINDDGTKQRLCEDMTHFLERYKDNLHGEFERRYGFDFMPEELGMDAPQFFEMVCAILADPAIFRRYETRSGAWIGNADNARVAR